MKHLLLIAFIAPGFLFAQSKPKPKTSPKVINAVNSYTITGMVTGFEDGTVVDLLNGNNGQPDATTKIEGGKFIIKGKVEYPDYKLISFNKQAPYITLFVDNSNIDIKGKKEALDAAVITGSKSNDEFIVYNKIMKTYDDLFRPDAPADSARRKSAAAAFEKYSAAHPDSYVSPIAVFRHFQLLGNGDRMEQMFEKLSKPVKSTPVGDFIRSQIAESRKNPVGKVLADFSQPDTSGVEFKLSSLRGKYVLVDFWASWCGPCRQENPNVLAAYNKFHNKNFTVLGVSLDRARQPWIDAIHADNLNWYHVSDLLFWQNAVAKQFEINSIPQNFLIDPNGVVIGKNLRGAALDNKLESVLGK